LKNFTRRQQEDEEEDARVAAATDMAFQIIRNGKECHKHGWLSTRLKQV
jgi:hypothetical protein